jgi:superfamily II DNA or RNA helicase
VDYMPVFIANGFYRNKTDFYNKHVVLKWDQRGHYPKIERYVDEGLLIFHRDSILIDMKFSRLTIPHHMDIYCEYNKDLYRRVEKDRCNPFELDEKGNEVPLKEISEVIRLLRKIVATSEDRTNKLFDIWVKHKKVIVFYNFDYELELLREWTNNHGICKAEWNGKKHEPLPDTDEWIYLVQYIAGAEGWNCTTCNTIVFYSQSYSYKQTEQACGRIDRLNTPFTDLYYYRFTSKSSIDIIIKKTLDRKEEFNDRKAAKELNKPEIDESDPFAQYYE